VEEPLSRIRLAKSGALGLFILAFLVIAVWLRGQINPPFSDSSSGSQPVGQPGVWKLVFSDDFNGPTLDISKWRTCFWWADTTCSIESNGELELYNPGNVLVQNGILRLRAQKESMLGWNGKSYNYTSGMVMSGGMNGVTPPRFSFTYGFTEVRVKIPAGQGLWPAFWLLPASYTWPTEVDIMEILGHQTRVIRMTYHDSSGGIQSFAWTGPDFSSSWRIIGLDWEPDALTWYVDGIERARYTQAALIPNTPLYLLLNLAVGGSWPGSPNPRTAFPSYFDVDYVRVWQKQS
jgi:beta-glucanase (GH16 family)